MVEVNVAPRTSLVCLLIGHQFAVRQSVLLAKWGCPVCGGKRYVQVKSEDGRDILQPCTACRETGWRDGVQPEIEDETRREKRRRINSILNPKARRQERRGTVKVIKDACVRCGASNPNRVDHTSGVIGWLIRLLTFWARR